MLVGKALKAEPGLGDKVQLVDGKFEANGDPAYVRAACEGEFETVGCGILLIFIIINIGLIPKFVLKSRLVHQLSFTKRNKNQF